MLEAPFVVAALIEWSHCGEQMVKRVVPWLYAVGLLLVPGRAFPNSFVVFEGEDPGLAVARVAVALARSPDALNGVDWSTHLDALNPSLVGVGSFNECSGDAADMASLQNAASEAEGALNFMEYEKALSVIQEARVLVGCLAVPIEPEVIARLLFLEGVVHMEQGDKMAAWGSFQGAHIADPELVWDENFPPDSRPVFSAAKSELTASAVEALRLAPIPGDVRVWIDGQALEAGAQTVDIKGRQHWVQWRDADFHSAELLMEPGLQVGIVLPSALGELPLHAVTSPAHHSVLTTLMASIGAPGDELFLTTFGGVWSHVVGQPGFEQIVAPTEEIPPLEENRTSEKVQEDLKLVTKNVTPRAWRNPLFLAGTGIALAAGTVARLGWTQADEAWTALDSDAERGEPGVSRLSDYEDYEQAWNDLKDASLQYRLGGAATIVGVALAGTGLFIGSGESVDAGVWASADELGARLTWTR